MKTIVLLLALFTISIESQAAQQICGLLKVSSSDGVLEVNIADMQSYSGKQQNFKVLNPLEFDWEAGSCICVNGVTSYDPEYGQDYLYMQVHVATKVSEDRSGQSCRPQIRG